VAAVSICQKLPACPTEPMPAGSKTDPPLAKAEPTSDSGSASVITDLRTGKKSPAQWQPKGRSERNNAADTNVGEERGAGGAPGAGAESPLQPVEKTRVRQVLPLQPTEFQNTSLCFDFIESLMIWVGRDH